MLCFDEKDRPHLEKLLEQGKKNGVEGLEILEKKELLHWNRLFPIQWSAPSMRRPEASSAPSSLNIALAENAAVNGVEFHLKEGVLTVEKADISGTCGKVIVW